MSISNIVYYCDCARPKYALDEETGQEFCLHCGGIIRDEDAEMDKMSDSNNSGLDVDALQIKWAVDDANRLLENIIIRVEGMGDLELIETIRDYVQAVHEYVTLADSMTGRNV